jgi:hypothetical protein
MVHRIRERLGTVFFNLVLESTMKISKKLLTGSVAAVVAAMGFSGTTNAAEVSASVAIANMYLWRGQDLGAGAGVPAVSGDLKVTESGFHTGIWGSSGDEASGTEYDLWVGYGASFGDFSFDLTLYNYIYPTGGGNDDNDGFGDLSEAVLTLGYGPVTFMYYDNISNKGGNNAYTYYTLSATFGSFTALVGYSLTEDAVVDFDGSTDDSDYTHIDLTYAYNENLSFTLSQVVDEGPDNDQVDDDLKFVVKYSLPIK